MDKETKQVLASICEILKAEITHTTAVDNAMIAVARAILESESELKDKYQEQWRQIVFSTQGAYPPQISAGLERLNQLIQQLKE